MLPGEYSGCFYITPLRASRNHHVDYANPDNPSTSFSLSLSIYPRPQAHGPAQQLAACRGPDRGRQRQFPEQRHSDGGRLVLLFQRPDVQARHQRAAELQGGHGQQHRPPQRSARFLVVSKTDAWEVPDVLAAKNVVHDAPYGKCTVKEVTKKSDHAIRSAVGDRRAAGESRSGPALRRLGRRSPERAAGGCQRPGVAVGRTNAGSAGAQHTFQLIFTRNGRGAAAVPGDPGQARLGHRTGDQGNDRGGGPEEPAVAPKMIRRISMNRISIAAVAILLALPRAPSHRPPPLRRVPPTTWPHCSGSFPPTTGNQRQAAQDKLVEIGDEALADLQKLPRPDHR